MFFHFIQSIWRKAQATGLQIPYRDDVKTLVRRAAILLLIPLASVEDAWFQALEDRYNTQLTQPFTEDFTDQRVEGDRYLRNYYGTEGRRTTNSIEGWHSKLKKMTQHAHPNIYTVIQLFKDNQNNIEIAIESSWWYHSTTGQEMLEQLLHLG